jgi:hypothetical protein
MLTRITLRFKDEGLASAYNAERRDYYKRVLPYLAPISIAFSIATQLIYKDRPMLRVINWTVSVLLLLMAIFVAKLNENLKWNFPIQAFCPLITCLGFYYFSLVDLESRPISVYFLSLTGTAFTFLTCVLFNEIWYVTGVICAGL